MNFMAPIPGMSLTKEPGNAPWEQPALYDKPEEALAFYLEKFNDEDTLDDLLFALEAGYPIDAMVDFLTSFGVMEGYHTVDVKMLISPILHEYILSLAKASGTKYTENLGPSRQDKMKEKEKKRTQVLLMKALEMGDEPDSVEEEMAGQDLETEDTEMEAMAPLIKRRM